LDQQWTGHWETVHNILLSFTDLVELLQDAQVNKRGTIDVRVEASGFLRQVNCAQFVFVGKMVHRVLDTFKPVDKSLQDRTIDLLTANRLVATTNDVIVFMRSQQQFDTLWEDTLSLVSPDDAKEICRRRKLNPKYASSVVYETVGHREAGQNSQKILNVK